jgi:hypothetical protein
MEIETKWQPNTIPLSKNNNFIWPKTTDGNIEQTA